MAKVAGVIGSIGGAVRLLAAISSRLNDYAIQLRSADSIGSAALRCEPFATDNRVGVEWYLDAEIRNGDAISWNVLAYKEETWSIEASISRIDRHGSKELWCRELNVISDEDVDRTLIEVTEDLLHQEMPLT